MKIDEVMRELDARTDGLSSEEVQKRLLEFGPNELKEEKRKSPVKLFLEQFTDILVIILLITILMPVSLADEINVTTHDIEITTEDNKISIKENINLNELSNESNEIILGQFDCEEFGFHLWNTKEIDWTEETLDSVELIFFASFIRCFLSISLLL